MEKNNDLHKNEQGSYVNRHVHYYISTYILSNIKFYILIKNYIIIIKH